MNLFRNIKFITTEQEAIEVALMILAANPELTDGMSEEDKLFWAQSHNTFMCQKLNAERTNFGSRAKDSVIWWRAQVKGREDSQENADNFPTVDDVYRCATRAVDLKVVTPDPLPDKWDPNDPVNVIKYSPDGWLFYWYWNVLLAKCLGRERFSTNLRHYNLLSEAKWHQEPTGKYQQILWGRTT